MKIRALIVDDETQSRKALKILLKTYCTAVEVIGEAGSVKEAKVKIMDLQPNLVFLDVEMPVENGFDLLRQLETLDFDVIFTTAHDTYAFNAFKYDAVDYLLKPIDPEVLIKAVNKVMKKAPNSTPDLKSSLKHLETLINGMEETSKKLPIPTIDNEVVFIALADIIRFQADSSYTSIFATQNRKYFVAKGIGEYEILLAERNFIRVHNSHLINLIHIQTYLRGDNLIVMSDGSKVDISTRRKKLFLEKIYSNH